MAAKQSQVEIKTGLKKIMKPVISTDVMGNRNVEVKAVGARAEPAFLFSQYRPPNAVVRPETWSCSFQTDVSDQDKHLDLSI